MSRLTRDVKVLRGKRGQGVYIPFQLNERRIIWQLHPVGQEVDARRKHVLSLIDYDEN